MSADQPPAPTPNVSETPRTDAAIVESILCTEGGDEECTVYPCVEHVESDFARQLERELAAALARAEKAEEDTRRLDWLEQADIMIQFNTLDSIRWNDALTKGMPLRWALDHGVKQDAAPAPTKEPAP